MRLFTEPLPSPTPLTCAEVHNDSAAVFSSAALCMSTTTAACSLRACCSKSDSVSPWPPSCSWCNTKPTTRGVSVSPIVLLPPSPSSSSSATTLLPAAEALSSSSPPNMAATLGTCQTLVVLLPTMKTHQAVKSKFDSLHSFVVLFCQILGMLTFSPIFKICQVGAKFGFESRFRAMVPLYINLCNQQQQHNTSHKTPLTMDFAQGVRLCYTHTTHQGTTTNPVPSSQYDLNEARMESVFIGISGLIGAGKVRSTLPHPPSPSPLTQPLATHRQPWPRLLPRSSTCQCTLSQ